MERNDVIMGIGTLATDAAQRGDDRAAAILRATFDLLLADTSAMDRMAERLAAIDREAEARRRKDRERHPRKASRAGPAPPSLPRNSTEFHGTERNSTEATEIHRGSPFSPTPPFNPSVESSRDAARESLPRLAGAVESDYDGSARAAAASDDLYADAVATRQTLLKERVGEDVWPVFDDFVRRRPFDTWKAWLDQILTLLTSTSATVEDVAQVCRDDGALERRVESPKGLRFFVRSAVEERRQLAAVAAADTTATAVAASAAVSGTGHTTGNGHVPRRSRATTQRAAALFSQIRRLIRKGDAAADNGKPSTFIRRADVEALGPDVVQAYDALGGAERFIGCPTERLGLLMLDFSNLLEN